MSRRLDAIIADFVANGPTEDEVRRAVMRTLSGRDPGPRAGRRLRRQGRRAGRGRALRQRSRFLPHPARSSWRAVTPAQVRAAMQRWLTRPVYALRVDPGEREAYEEAPGVSGSRAGGARRRQPAPALLPPAASRASSRSRRSPPRARPSHAPLPMRRADAGVGAIADARLPRRSSAPRLSNGIQVVYARRTAVPVTRVAVEFDAGIAADPADRLGTQALMLNLLDEGTTSLNSIQLAEAQERLGATIGTGASLDRTAVTPDRADAQPRRRRSICSPTSSAIRPSPRRRSSGSRQQQLAGIAAEMTQPARHRARARCPAVLYGTDHPYGKPFTGTGDPAVVRALTRDELIALPPDLDPARQCDDLRGRRSAARPSSSPQLEAPLRQLARAGGAARDQGVHRADPGAAAAHRPDRPAAIAAVASSSPARSCRPRAPQDLLNLHRRQRGARRQLPVADQHGAARAARLVLRRARRRQPARASGALHHPGAGPGRPHRRFDRGGDRAGARLPDQQRRPADRAEPDHPRQHPPAARPVRDLGRRCSARCAPTRSTAAPTIIGRRSPTAIAA